ncbi:MAG: hypothetical protein PHV23_01455 [Candidatus Gracilibacteria bacterium]|nr:hypothetical protein [Candidatus Gracilibacteria bacterium]
MKILLIRFEKETLHYIFLDSIDNLNFKINNLSMDGANSDGEKYFRLLQELNLLNSTYNPDLIVYHSSLKTQRGLDELRYSNEAFLKYFGFTQKINILEVNKVLCRQKLKIKMNIFNDNFNLIREELLDKKIIAKTNIMLDGLTLLLLIKNII